MDRTAETLVRNRGWCLRPEEVRPALEEMGVRRIPDLSTDAFLYGGALCFPLLDHSGKASRAQLRYLKPALHDDQKCTFIGDRTPTSSAIWFGAGAKTLAQIAELKRVLLVEGPSDLLACHIALEGRFPVLAIMGNTIRAKQVADLHLLGVQKVYLMLDGDEVGLKSAKSLKEKLPFRVQILACPEKDPAECLKTQKGWMRLRCVLSASVG